MAGLGEITIVPGQVFEPGVRRLNKNLGVVASAPQHALDTQHFVADGVTTIAAADASDLATSETLANEMRTDANTHIDFAGASQTITLTPSA